MRYCNSTHCLCASGHIWHVLSWEYEIDDSPLRAWMEQEDNKAGKAAQPMDEGSDGEFEPAGSSASAFDDDDYVPPAASVSLASKVPYKKTAR